MTEENRDRDTESQGPEQDAAADAGPVVAEDVDGGSPPEEPDRERFPLQEDAALKYVADNKYAYGPRLSKIDMDWIVTAAEYMGARIVRVTIEYVPIKSFRGTSGSEYVDVDEDGVVLARRQVRVPRENKPWVLIGLAAISIIAAAVLVPFILISSDAVDPLYVQGRTLWMRAEKPIFQDAVHYVGLDTSGQQHEWAIEPVDSNTVMAIVEVTIINATSGSVRLVVDGDAAEVRLVDVNDGVKPVDVIDRASPTDSYSQALSFDDFIPVWGSLTLNSNEQIHGHMVFEVPDGASIREFRWRATDTMSVRY